MLIKRTPYRTRANAVAIATPKVDARTADFVLVVAVLSVVVASVVVASVVGAAVVVVSWEESMNWNPAQAWNSLSWDPKTRRQSVDSKSSHFAKSSSSMLAI